MIAEDYISFETAKLLKEKGFDDEYTNAFYDKNGNLYFIDILSDFSEHSDNDTDIAASTLYVAMKWLREVHHLHLSIDSYPHEDNCFYWCYKVLFMDESDLCSIKKHAKASFNSFEAAVEAAIKYCLENLI